MESLIQKFAAILRELELPASKLSADYCLANLAELDDVLQAAIDAESDLSEIGLALAGARVLVRFEREA